MAKAAMAAAPESIQEEADESYDKWKAKDDMRTLLEYGRIKADPVRMRNVKRCAKEELAEMEAMKALAAGK